MRSGAVAAIQRAGEPGKSVNDMLGSLVCRSDKSPCLQSVRGTNKEVTRPSECCWRGSSPCVWGPHTLEANPRTSAIAGRTPSIQTSHAWPVRWWTPPTQGMDKSTGVSRKGKDVQRAELQEAVAAALRPLTGSPPRAASDRHATLRNWSDWQRALVMGKLRCDADGSSRLAQGAQCPDLPAPTQSGCKLEPLTRGFFCARPKARG